MIQFENFTVQFSNKMVLNNFCLNVRKSSVHGLVGMNGSGKSTFFKAACELIEKQNGKITHQNQIIETSEIAFLETENYFYPKIKASEYLELFRLNNPKFNPNEWNKLFELPLNQLVENYSTGMRKKLALLGVLALNRSILFLDEPFNGLDLESNEKLKFLIELQAKQGKTIIVTSHILDPLLSVCEKISYLNNQSNAGDFEKNDFISFSEMLKANISKSFDNINFD